ncbi:hypothetical protein FBU30_011291 [Linnemannia zychae]|nr:hypothetical protein FBU30_011291 [Linnemannia zychae]
MSGNHSYAQIPVAEAQDDHTTNAATATPSSTRQSILNTTFNLPRFSSSANGYAKIQNHGELEELDEDNVMLHPLPTTSSASHPRPKQQSESPIDVGESSSAPTAPTPAPAGPSIPHFPVVAGTRRMIQRTMDGVFSNLSAKPRIEQSPMEELPPPYKAAAMDQTPAYYETTDVSPFHLDEVLVDGLPNGSKMGLGITFLTMGTQMMSGAVDGQDSDPDADTGYMGNADGSLQAVEEYMGFSYLMIFLGLVVMLHSCLSFIKAKRTEMVINATSLAQTGEASTVNVSIV